MWGESERVREGEGGRGMVRDKMTDRTYHEINFSSSFLHSCVIIGPFAKYSRGSWGLGVAE